MRRALALSKVAAALAILAAALPGVGVAVADQASQLRPIDLRVFGGEDAWHPDNDFRLDWDQPPIAAQGFPVSAVHYRVRSATGAVAIAATRLPWETAQIENLHVPWGPGVYTADVWLEGPGGQEGPETSAALRFDDARPGPARPLTPAGWFAGNAAAVVTIAAPTGPQPISGIRGYAVSVDRGAGSAPCLGQDRCSLAETDLRDGIGAGTISLGLLPEGANVVRAVAVSGSGMRSPESRSAIVRVDATLPEVVLGGVPRGWAAGPVRVAATATDSMSGMAAAGPNGPFTAIAVDGGVPRAEPGGAATAVVSGEGSHSVAFYARDGAGNVGEESPPRTMVRIDESPPRIAFATAQNPADPERIEAIVSDLLSGPDPGRGSIALRPAGSRQRFSALPTVVSGNRLIARWDSDAFTPGTYEFRASGYDAAGNAGASDRRGNGTRMVLVNPLKAPTAIAAGFGAPQLIWGHCAQTDAQCRRERIESLERRSANRATAYGRGIPYSGQLTSASGAPLGRLPVQVIETFAAGADSPQRTTTLQTAADGTFRTRLAPGPSRSVEVVFAGNRTLSRSGGGDARLRVLGGVRLHASASSARVGGAPLLFSGRIGALGASLAADGRAVELQFRFPGSAWSEFRTVPTDARGRFRYAYSFSDDDSRGVRFQFRAYAPAEEGWPYEPAFSRPVFVTGR